MIRCSWKILLGIILLNLHASLKAQVVKTDTRSHYETDLEKKTFSVDWVGWKQVSIPFEFTNNLIIIDIQFNQTFPLRFIFDTGAEYTILTQKTFADIGGLRYVKKFSIMGADMKTELVAYLARNAHLRLGRMIAPNEAMLVLAEDYFRYDEIAGLNIHGILGADFFRRYIVEINYESRQITLTKPEYFKRSMKKYQAIPIEVTKNKPYLKADVDLTGDSTRNLKFLMDTGASLPLLIYTDTDTTMTIPPNALPGNIGRGLGGFLSGYQGRIQTLQFSDFNFKEVITSFQASDSIQLDLRLINNRNGIIGNEILSRFNVVFDYWNEVIYLKPNKNYRNKFKYDRSGLILIASGKNLNRYTVQYVVPNSPADEANIQKGDTILKINRVSTKILTMDGVVQKLRKRIGKRIKLLVERDGVRHKVDFRLREIL